MTFFVTSRIKGTINHTIRLGMKNIDFEVPLVQSDTGPLIKFFIVDNNGEPKNLTDHTVGFVFKRSGYPDPINPNSSGCSILDAEAGEVLFSFAAADLEEPGTYFGDLVVKSPSGFSETASDPVRFIVRSNNK